MNFHVVETMVGTLTPICVGTVFVVSRMRKPYMRLSNMLDDWNGEVARPGVPGRKGVMVRLQHIENKVEASNPNQETSLHEIQTSVDHINDN